jgi:predicted GNAT family acetyltransferase
MDIRLNHKEKDSLFIARVDKMQARLQYTMRNKNTIDFISTYVPPEIRNKGIGQRLAKAGLDYAKENNFKVIPTCSFIRDFIDKNSEFKNLVEEK